MAMSATDSGDLGQRYRVKWLRYCKLMDRLCTPVIAYRMYSLWSQVKAHWHSAVHGPLKIRAFGLVGMTVIQVTIAVLMTPVTAVARALGYRFLMVDLSQIGSLMWIDLYVREMMLDGRRYRRIFIARSPYTDANTFGIDLYKSYFTFIANPWLKLLAIPFFVNPWTRDDTFRYDAPFVRGKRIGGNQGSYSYPTHAAHTRKFGGPVIRISDRDREKAWRALTPILAPGDKFVALHARDSGFYQDAHRTTRNSNIRDFEPGLRYLIGLGYKIIRLGDAGMVGIDDLVERLGPNLIDYAHMDIKSELLDLFLVSECDFFVGCASGMLSLPIIFNRPACFVNFYNATTCLGYLPGDISIFKKIRRKDDGSLVPFDALMEPPLSENIQHKELDSMGLYLEDNSPTEILEAFREFIERRGQEATPRQKMAKHLIPPMRHSYGGAGDFGEVILRQYFPVLTSPPPK